MVPQDVAPQDNDFRLPSASRRSFLSLSAAASAALAFRIVTEPMLAHARVHNVPKDAIRIDANENPLGPCAPAREAAAAIVSEGGRDSDSLHRPPMEQAGGDGRAETET